MFDPRAQTVGGFNNKTASVIPISQIRRMRNSCCESQENVTLLEKMELRAKSQERVQKWPNSQNIRRRKNETRFEHFREDEEERRRIEKEEAEYQLKTKQDVLEKANKQIYENNPRVRQFQAKQLLTDVLQEREAQLQMNDYKKTINSVKEQIHYEEMLENMAKLEQIEIIKKDEFLRKQQEQKKILKQQHDEMINNHIRQIQNERIEGQLNKAKAEQLIKDEENAEKERKRKRLENILQIQKGNQEIQELKQQALQKEKEEEEKIKVYAEKKERVSEMRKQREALKLKEKQDQRQRLIDAQIANLAKIASQQQNLLHKHIEEAEIKAEEIEKNKKLKQLEMKRQIDESRKINAETKSIEEAQKLKNDKGFQEYWKQRGEELKKIETSENEQIKKRNIQLKEFHLQQIDQKQKNREQEILKEIEERDELLRKRECEHRTFSSWAERAVKEWSDNGKNVQPLLKELRSSQQF